MRCFDLEGLRQSLNCGVCRWGGDLEEVVDVFHLLLEANVVKVHSQAVLVVPVEVGEESFHQTVNEQNWGRGGGGAKGGREVKRFTMLKSFSSKQHRAYKLLI